MGIMENNHETMKFTVGLDSNKQAREIMDSVYSSLVEKGYNPISQTRPISRVITTRAV